MREIKFRAWDTEDKRKVKEFNIHHDGDLTEIRMYVGDVPVIASNVCGRYKILQFTGLKDKNGKEIYEGDIIKLNNKLFKIAWNQFSCGFGRIPIDTMHYERDDCIIMFQDKVEVIGNIYENKELLSDGK